MTEQDIIYQAHGSVSTQIYDQVSNKIWNDITNIVDVRVRAKIIEQLCDLVVIQVWEQVGGKIQDKVLL